MIDDISEFVIREIPCPGRLEPILLVHVIGAVIRRGTIYRFWNVEKSNSFVGPVATFRLFLSMRGLWRISKMILAAFSRTSLLGSPHILRGANTGHLQKRAEPHPVLPAAEACTGPWP
jgi:hypothetical protein